MKYSKEIFIGAFTSWSVLGFKRGIDDYNYKYKKLSNKKTYLYSKKILFGFSGALLYACPIFYLITIPKEIYRLEVNLRSLEDEKKTDYYNELE
jgi:hypothetical protein